MIDEPGLTCPRFQERFWIKDWFRYSALDYEFVFDVASSAWSSSDKLGFVERQEVSMHRVALFASAEVSTPTTVVFFFLIR